MARIAGNLWEYNLSRIVVVDVTDDYRLAQPPLPSDLYPVIRELRVPTYSLPRSLARMSLADGYLYDWHERPLSDGGDWYVGVVDPRAFDE
jgi:hypothetical protein